MIEPDSVDGHRLTQRSDLDDDPNVIPVVEERLHVRKTIVGRGTVRVSTRPEAIDQLVKQVVRGDRVIVDHLRIDRELVPDEPPPTIRTEGRTTIIPVLEEILVVERRLVLREEVRIERIAEDHEIELPITLLRQRAVIERVSLDGSITRIGPETKDSTTVKHTITALFDQETKARIAMDDLIEAGVPRGDVRVVPGATDAVSRSTGAYDHHKDEGGFWAALKSIFMPDEDRYTYSEGLARGGSMLTVEASDADRARLSDMLERSGAVDLNQREASWRQDGWSGYPTGPRLDEGARDTASFGRGSASTGIGDKLATATEDATFAAGSFLGGVEQKVRQAVGAREDRTDPDYIPVVEERLNVGKRVVDHGRVRLRSYVVETPVQEQVHLHDEIVEVDRRKVDRPLSAHDVDPFAARTVEVDEKGEEVVVNKEARVVEEVSLRKHGVDRTETVNDKVRRTEVEIEDERRGAAPKPFGDRT